MTALVKRSKLSEAFPIGTIQGKATAQPKELTFFEKIERAFSEPTKGNLNDYLISKFDALSRELKELTFKINLLNSFVKANKDLESLCAEYMKKFPEYIVIHSDNSDHKLDPKNVVDQVTALELDVITKRALLEESEEFIKRHEQLYDTFVKLFQDTLRKQSRKKKV